MSHPIDYTVRQNVALITIDNPPVNATGAGVPQAIMDAIARAAADLRSPPIVVMGAGKTFIAGADISVLEEAAWGKLEAAMDLHPLLAAIEDSRQAGRDGDSRQLRSAAGWSSRWRGTTASQFRRRCSVSPK